MSLDKLDKYRQAKSDIVDFIEYLSWAQELEYREVFNLAGYFQAYTIQKNQTLFLEGSIESYMVIVVKGQISIVKDTSESSMQVINTMRSGKVFGELSLLDGYPRSATARAQSNSIIYVLTMEEYLKMQKENPRIALFLVLKMARITSQRLRQTTGQWVELLSSLDEDEDTDFDE